MDKDDVIKFIDGKVFYYSDYINFLYKQLELKDNIIKEVKRHIEIILEIALDQDSENVNLIDRLKGILEKLRELKGDSSNE